jgi:hypothetical protein
MVRDSSVMVSWRFQAKWTPGRVKKTRQNKLQPCF